MSRGAARGIQGGGGDRYLQQRDTDLTDLTDRAVGETSGDSRRQAR